MNILRVGTDCSGIEAPIEALKQMGAPFRHCFSCEIDPECRKSILANYSPEILFEDITKRNIEDVPDIDLYVCGFPCQPFSSAGKTKGFQDKRGNIFFNCIEVIKIKKPSYFILENVKNLKSHNKGETWKTMWNELNKLDYNISFQVLNTKHYGIPQNRERLYIVGSKYSFTFPKPNLPLQNLRNFVSEDDSYQETSERHEEILSRTPENSIFIEFAFGVSGKRSFVNSGDVCPCITANTRIWCVPKHRYATPQELLTLQGFSNFKQVVSNTQLKKQVGNSMSVCVLKAILGELIRDV